MKLNSLGIAVNLQRSIIGKITSNSAYEQPRTDFILLHKDYSPPLHPREFAAILTPQCVPEWTLGVPLLHSVKGMDYLTDGDVVQIEPHGFIRTLYRKNSHHNFLLATEQCNSYCLMCSQPPKQIDDSARVHDLLKTIDLMNPVTKELGITGGEPTLLGEGFLSLVRRCKNKLPDAALHILTNGRLFSERAFASRLAQIQHPDLMLGIPLYSDLDFQHDYIVQARGAFDETLLGLYNLADAGIPVEIRVVIHKQTYSRLARLAEFIVRNLPFVAHIALMGLENTGFTKINIEKLWIDPIDYQTELTQATEILFLAGHNVSIYNHQLCVLDTGLWPFARKSISDWKNIYLDECTNCEISHKCGGFFQSSLNRHSRAIRPFHEAIVLT